MRLSLTEVRVTMRTKRGLLVIALLLFLCGGAFWEATRGNDNSAPGPGAGAAQRSDPSVGDAASGARTRRRTAAAKTSTGPDSGDVAMENLGLEK